MNEITTKIGKCIDQKITERAALYNGDSCQIIKSLPDNSIDFTIYSPPFSSLYTYSNRIEDLGNSTADEFIEQFRFLLQEIYRVTKPGRLHSVHCMNLPTLKQFDGYIGLKDFRGDIIRACREIGWIFHAEVSIFKCPVQQVTRTKALGLLHKTIRKDSSMCRQGLADYLVTFRKPGENKEPISHTHDNYPVYKWQNTASPTYVIDDNPLELGYTERQQFFQALWDDVRVGDVLKYREGRDSEDQRHICPLQLQVIRRALDLWTNPNDIVLSPFLGIGSEGYCSLERGRRFVGIELKESYFRQAVRNVENVQPYSLESDLKPYKVIDDAKVAKDPKKRAARAQKEAKFKAEQLEMFPANA